jgi:hypothetical protein
MVLIRLVKGDAALLLNSFLALSQRGIHHLQKVTETAPNIATEAATLATLLSDMDINNPDGKMTGSPFVAQ